ncbi:hypothetical protein OSB04_010176 [Centaurea solstitialis]|uniref:Cytochrome P450 n=1 Tax=Centaurea solstitialis TaxID=347529 RepID=A0AA38WBN3_9ASTR|nr:hypothetical protein OSB04_010176 [Centaurea solstitialis]
MTTQLNTNISWWWQVVVFTIIVVILAISWLWSTTTSNGDGPPMPPLPPGPVHLPIIGYLPFLDRNLHTQFTDMARTYGPIFKVRVGSKLHIVINTPDLARAVVRDQDETFANRPLTVAASISTYGGQDIAWSNHNVSWRKLRKVFVHEVLSIKNLEACSGIRRDQVREMIKDIYGKIGTALDLNEIFFSTIAKVLTSMIWQNSLDEEGADYGHLAGVERDIRKEANKLDGIITSVIEDRIKYNSKNNSHDDINDAVGKKDVLQVLLDLKDHATTSVDITIADIKALLTVSFIYPHESSAMKSSFIANDIMVAGPEATTLLIQWTMVEIMQNPEVMKKVQEELAQVVGPSNIVEESHLSKLKYLDATIKETFRLHPVVPLLVPRSPSKTCTGSSILGKSLEFNPERFLAHEAVDKYDFSGNNLNFFPFGSGRRVCAGVPLAEKSQMLILASLLHSFNWSLPKGEELDLSDIFCVTLRKRKPLVAIPSQRLPNTSLYM